MLPGGIVTITFSVLNGGTPVTGLTTANFTLPARFGTLAGVTSTPTLTFSVVEISGGEYFGLVTLPTTLGYVKFQVTSNAGYTVNRGGYWGEIETNDLDTIGALVVRPVTQLSTGLFVAASVPLTITAYRYVPLSVTVTTQAGGVVDRRAYTGFLFTIWNQSHTGGTFLYQQSTGITGSALGVVAWSLPKTMTNVNAAADTAIAAGNNSTVLYYDMVANIGGISTETVSLFAGQLTVNRYEGTE